MRVTSNMMANMVKSSIFRQSEKLMDAQETLTSQKKIQKPSDDPFGAERILSCRAEIGSMEQFHTNIQRSEARFSATDHVLDTVDDFLGVAREFAVENNCDNPPEEQRIIAAENIKAAREQIAQLINTRMDGDYIFGGYQTEAPPVTVGSGGYVIYNGDDGGINAIIGQNLTMQVNVTGLDLFSTTPNGAGEEEVDVLRALQDMETELRQPAGAFSHASFDAWIDQVEAARDKIKVAQARSAARTYAMDAARNQLAEFRARLQNMLSEIEDADMDQAAVELIHQRTVYEAALKSSAMVIQHSLVDFLR
ncbi:MAG: flagellar hook-associated protein 3 [Desulfobacterales bacterium]|nr:MAG: flagellar hook-associated protein 3 [Desulfobacterales bacterium]